MFYTWGATPPYDTHQRRCFYSQKVSLVSDWSFVAILSSSPATARDTMRRNVCRVSSYSQHGQQHMCGRLAAAQRQMMPYVLVLGGEENPRLVSSSRRRHQPSQERRRSQFASLLIARQKNVCAGVLCCAVIQHQQQSSGRIGFAGYEVTVGTDAALC